MSACVGVWLRRYVPAEAASLVGALVAAQLAWSLTDSGAVTAVVNGKNQLLSLTIKKEAVDPEDVEMLQDLIMAAVNEALAKVHAEMAEQMGKITGGLNIPGLF